MAHGEFVERDQGRMMNARDVQRSGKEVRPKQEREVEVLRAGAMWTDYSCTAGAAL